ncbi:MAG: PEP-CTERM sorting domain-containing protein [Pirellulales bacterium]
MTRSLNLVLLSAFALVFSQARLIADVIPTTNLLEHGDFGVSSPPLTYSGANPDEPWTPGVWNADDADLIVGNIGPFVPHSPHGMLRVNPATYIASQVSQIVDVSSFADAIDTGNLFVEFSVWVNAPAGGIETGIQLRNLPSPLRPSRETGARVDPMLGERALVVATSSTTIEWQQIGAVHPLEPNTRFLHYEFYAINETIPAAGVFFDDASITVIPPASTLGDFNDDGLVDAADYVTWRDQFGTLIAGFSGADANGNGVVDSVDIQTWRSNFGTTLAMGWGDTEVVPEPASVALFVTVGIALAFSHRRLTVKS